MNTVSLTRYRQQQDVVFHGELFCDAIWGDNGEDHADVSIYSAHTHWKLHYIRTQSGIPYPFAEPVCKIIDEYERCLDDEQLLDFLLMHGWQEAFAALFEPTD